MNIPLLRRLREAGGAFVPLDDPDAGDWRRDLRELEAFGFRFERDGASGVAYRGAADRLCPDLIEWELGTTRIGRRVAVWNRLTSTNDLAARAANSRLNDGLVILAEEQTAGRGRRGRTWSAPAHASILLSTLIFPPESAEGSAWLTALGAVATAEVVESTTGRPARIKWPNDVRVEGRKVAGVLVEQGAGAVLGIGLNANLGSADFPDDLRERSTSLRILAGSPVDRSEVARSLIVRLDVHYARALAEGPRSLVGPWRARLEALGRPVRVETALGATLEGRLLDADFALGLTLADAEGRLDRVAAHEVLALTPLDESAPPR